MTDWSSARGEKWRANLSGMEAMLAPVDEPLINALSLDVPCTIADVGCGGGGTSFEILRRAPKGSVVHGFDLSPALIDTARQRASKDPAIAFELADMSTARAPTELYDRLVSRFGVMFFDDADVAFANLASWLAPSGRFAFAVWGPTAENPWMTTVRDVVAEVVKLPPSDPDAPGPFRYGDASKLLTVLDRAGFGGLDARTWQGPLPIGGALSAADAANFAIASFSSFGDLLTEAGGDALQRARESLMSRFAKHEKDGAITLDACVHIVTGVTLRCN